MDSLHHLRANFVRLRPACVLLPALLALAACGKPKEVEPNDHFTAATTIKPRGRVLGAMGSPEDIDVYRIDILQPAGVLSFQLGGIRGIDFVVSFQDKDRQELKRFDETSTGGDEQGLDLGVTRGVYYLALSNKDPKAEPSSQEYALDLDLQQALGNEIEPDDTPLMACPLVIGGVTRGHYHPSSNLLSTEPGQPEEDWFRMDIEREGTFALNIDVSEVPKVDGILEIYDTANFYKIKEVDSSGPGEAEIIKNFGVRGPAKYLVRLRSKTRSSNPAVRYEILTELLPYTGAAEFEPNDQRLDATPFVQDRVEGHISPAADEDWYILSVSTETKRILSLNLSPLPGMDLVLTLTDDLGNTVVEVDNQGKEQPEILTGMGIPDGGTYHISVREKSGKAADSRRPYFLSRTLTPFQPGLEFEVNDSSFTAQPMKVGESMDGYIAPKGDVDWYWFNVYQDASVSVDVTAVLNVRFVLSLYDQDYKEIFSTTADKPGEPVSFQRELKAGTYAVRLRSTDPQHNNVRDKYTLRVRAQ